MFESVSTASMSLLEVSRNLSFQSEHILISLNKLNKSYLGRRTSMAWSTLSTISIISFSSCLHQLSKTYLGNSLPCWWPGTHTLKISLSTSSSKLSPALYVPLKEQYFTIASNSFFIQCPAWTATVDFPTPAGPVTRTPATFSPLSTERTWTMLSISFVRP